MNIGSHSELLLSAASLFGTICCAVLACIALVRSKRDLRVGAAQFGTTLSAILIEMSMSGARRSPRHR